ncbi:MAG: hypothetical protein KKE62_01900 [Proteobacteria bacterium]|jgi:hypothetical protein|nr:hypothetical protein [Pseudomonadota bacterium]MBU1387108.1 hypothetical protein [Pseudomonadota bacterium]MBU1541575.1 hypothetical protein [Pseudomonadota bacterium]MBU2429521.1 hypothetical protein [Pseudomonadota bacterium]MBU2482532.1 hypothetical protein [Pseudomonadota bacterium]
MKDSRYKEIMKGLGMPNSRSLLSALQQVANEVAQQVHSDYEKNNKKLQTDAIVWVCECGFQNKLDIENCFGCHCPRTAEL